MSIENSNSSGLSHFDEKGAARMVDVSQKDTTVREATAVSTVVMKAETLALIQNNGLPKGDVIATARIAGIMAAKKTAELIPLCHPLPISAITIDFNPHDEIRLKISATVRTKSQTGVEMEALVAAGIASLTVYDMCKAVDRGMTIESTQLVEKIGGKSGRWNREE